MHRVVKTFGATAALRGVNAVVEARQLTLIEGPNGSGKSTLLKVLGTIMRPTSGSVSYEPLGQDHHLVRSQIGWLSHEPLAYGDLSGRENVELAARLHGIEAKEAWQRVQSRFELGRSVRRCPRFLGLTNRQVLWDRLPAFRISAALTGWKPIPRTSAAVIDRTVLGRETNDHHRFR